MIAAWWILLGGWVASLDGVVELIAGRFARAEPRRRVGSYQYLRGLISAAGVREPPGRSCADEKPEDEQGLGTPRTAGPPLRGGLTPLDGPELGTGSLPVKGPRTIVARPAGRCARPRIVRAPPSDCEPPSRCACLGAGVRVGRRGAQRRGSVAARATAGTLPGPLDVKSR